MQSSFSSGESQSALILCVCYGACVCVCVCMCACVCVCVVCVPMAVSVARGQLLWKDALGIQISHHHVPRPQPIDQHLGVRQRRARNSRHSACAPNGILQPQIRIQAERSDSDAFVCPPTDKEAAQGVAMASTDRVGRARAFNHLPHRGNPLLTFFAKMPRVPR